MKLYYVHDPMCSWCWAFRPVYYQLKEQLAQDTQHDIELIRLLGGLAPDSDEPMSEKTRQYVLSNWQQIEKQVPTTQFNYQFWEKCQPRRSTYPACRAVIAASMQGAHYDELITYAIQQAYYLQAKNPSDLDTLIALAGEIGCDAQQFEKDIQANYTEDLLQQELKLARDLRLNSFPGFLLINQQQYRYIEPDYHNVDALVSNIFNGIEV